MLEALILLIFVIGMARKARGRRRRSMGRYIRGPLDEDFALGTLAANTAVLEATPVVGERTLISSVEAIYSLAGFTSGDNIGPIEVGLAHSDYSLAEVEEFLEQTTGWNEGDLVSREVSSRKIRRIGVFGIPSSAGGSSTLNDGKPIKTKLNWILNAGQGLNIFAYNQGGSPVATSDPNVHVVGKANLFPK